MTTWVFASAALMAIGAFGPWVKVLGLSVNGTDGGNDGWIVVAAAVVGGVIFARKREQRAAGLAPLLAGAVATITCVYDRQNVSDAISEAGAFGEALAQVGWGLNLALLASISFAVAGAVWWRTAPLDAAAEEQPQPVPSAD
jgi:FtsH-binding integral membrane protein